MNKPFLFVVLVIFVFLLGCTTLVQEVPSAGVNIASQVSDPQRVGTPVPVVSSQKSASNSSPFAAQGKILAGAQTPYIDFNKADYDRALAESRIIVLYFYANWCPLCKIEEPETFAAFDSLALSTVVGFRVNYKDSDTDDDEVALARQFGVTYQHTKIIIKNGQRVVKAPDSWGKDRYVTEIKTYSLQ